MRNHTLNLYRIANLPNLDFSYKLVETNLGKLSGKEDLYNKQMLKVAQKVSSLISGPAAPIHKDGKLFIAIPADKQITTLKVDIAPLSVSLKPLDEIYHINAGQINNQNKEVVQKFLDFEMRRQLGNNQYLWKLNSGQFFQKRPVQSNEDSSIEIFGGFNYKLVALENGQFYVAVDITYKYIDKQPLCNFINEKNAQTIAGASYKGRKFLYQNGDNWYTTELIGFGKTIKDQDFVVDGQTHTVHDYIISKTARGRLDIQSLLKPEHISIFYKYPGRYMEPHLGASSLAKRLYQTNDPEVKSLHRYSIKDPNKRFETINKIVTTFFLNLTFNGQPLNINKASETEKVNSFPIPALLYNKEKILEIGSQHSGISLSDYGKQRRKFLMDNGVLTQTNFDAQYLIVPDSLDRALVSAIKRNAEAQIKALAPGFIDFKIIRYKTDITKSATYQVQDIEKALKAQNALSGFALFVLPDIAIKQKRQITIFHDCLKSKFYPDLKVQCVSGYKMRGFFQAFTGNGEIEFRVPEHQKPKFRSYLTNLVFEHLLMNRKWPFALAKNLHYDIYIGIDVHDRYAGFTFFFKNGQEIFFASEPVPKKIKSQRAEKLKANLLYKALYDKLKQLIPLHAPNPNGIVIIRDGRSFGEEEKALSTIIAELEKENIITTGTVKYGVVDLHKQSIIPFRLASQTNGYNHLENPLVGTYKLLSGTEGFLFNTGYPFIIPGTAKPLHLSLKTGNVEFVKIMEDIFHQSMLAFSAPDRSNALPITIKLIDTLLEPLTGATEEEEEDENETDDELQESLIDN